MRSLKRIATYLMVFGVIFIALGLIISSIYEEEVEKYIVREIRKQMKSELVVEDISFSVLEKFPYASLAFNNVHVEESIIKIGELDTLFYFEKVYLQFNLWDIFKGEYRIKKVLAENGFIRLRVDQDGYDNFHFWKEGRDSTASFLLELDKVEGNDFTFSYQNELRNQFIAVGGSDISFSGAFSEKQHSMDIEADLAVQQFKIRETNYVINRRVEINTELVIDGKAESYTFHNGDLVVDNKSQFYISGALLEDGIDLDIEGRDLDIVSTLALLPKETTEPLNDYSSEGTMDFTAKLKGAFSTTSAPSVDVTFGITDGTVSKKGTSYSLDHLNMEGSFTNGARKSNQSSVLAISSLDAQLGQGKVNSHFTVSNLDKPSIEGEIIADLELSEWQQFIDDPRIENIEGKAQLHANYKGIVEDPSNFTAKDFQKANCSGKIGLQGVSIKTSDSRHPFNNLSGELTIHNNDVLIKSLHGKVAQSDFQIKGLLRNLIAYTLLEGEELTVEAEVESPKIDLDILLEDNTESDAEYKLIFPENVAFNLKVKTDSLLFRKFSASNISGVIQLAYSKLKVNSIRLNTMEGTFNGDLVVQNNQQGAFVVIAKGNASHLNVSSLFNDLENLGQNVIEARHLRGFASTTFALTTIMDSNIVLRPNDITANADVRIDEGELIGLEPMQDIADNIREHKVVSLFVKADELERRLQHIQFSTLENRIEISNSVIHIPHMEIKSSALDIHLEGSHTFDNAINYKMSFFLSELIAKQNLEAVDEEGLVDQQADGGTRIFMTLTGTVEEPIITFEKNKIFKSGIRHLAAGTAKEAKKIKDHVVEDIKYVASDSIAAPEEKEERFAIEWEEDPNIGKKPELEKKDPPKKEETKKTPFKKLIKKLETEKDRKDLENTKIEDEDDDF